MADFEDADACIGTLGQDEGSGNAHGLAGGLVSLGASLWVYECSGLKLLHKFKVLRFNDGWKINRAFWGYTAWPTGSVHSYNSQSARIYAAR